LKGEQTVCSPKCRTARARQKREAKLRDRDANIRLHLKEALTLLEPEKEPAR
jgi:hypothetical protein